MMARVSAPSSFGANTPLRGFPKFAKRMINAGNMGCRRKSPRIAEFGT